MNEYEIAHSSVGIVDAGATSILFVDGNDRAAWLQGLLTNDIQALLPGRGCYAAWLTPQGRMITDMRVLELGGRMLLNIPASPSHDGNPAESAAALAARLDQLVFAEDVRITNASDRYRMVRVVGPASPRMLVAALQQVTKVTGLSDADFAQWAEYQNATQPINGSELIVVRDDGLGVIGFDVYGPDVDKLRLSLERSGAARLGPPIAEVLRIEAGRPLFGIDMDTSTIPLEAGIENRAISFTKGCYVGQEVIVRVTSRGHGRVARRLVGFVLQGTRVPNSAERVFTGDQEIGKITSAAHSPALKRPIAMGYVRREFAEPDRQVTIGSPSGEIATVVELPFVTSHPSAITAQ